MTIDLTRLHHRHHYYYFYLITLCYLFSLTITAAAVADNITDYHSNETVIEFNTTLISVTKVVADITTEEAFFDNNTDVSTSVILINSMVTSTEIPLETVEVTTVEVKTTVKEEHDSTTMAPKVSTQKPDESTTTTMMMTTTSTTEVILVTSCESSKYGCCPDNATKRTGPNNEGCHDDSMNVTMSNSTMEYINETDFVSTVETDNITMTTDKSDVILETSTGTTNISVTNEVNTTEFEVKNTTSSNFETTTEFEVENTTSISFENMTIEVSENSTMESMESTTETEPELETTAASSNLCVDNEFECCPDGETPAQGPEFKGCNTTEKLRTITTNVSFSNVCDLEKDAGSCSKYVNMWAYDRQQGKCVRFWYGSCEGNGNRFENEQQCQETCVSPKGIEVCLLSKVTGPCQSSGVRYYYDRDKQECQQFRYGGCNGNANNYASLEKCQSTCEKETVDQCTQPMEVGSCKGEFTRFYYDTITGQCRSFIYGGCKKNRNNFVTLKDCLNTCVKPRQKDICLQPKVIGTCQERHPSWYFDIMEGDCKLFQYSGCKGNHNRFSSKDECDHSCSSLKTSKTFVNDTKTICNLPMVRGSCDQQISRWYFNPSDKYCHPYQYTGCHGNANSFENEQDCRDICHAKEKDICTLEKDSGSCDQYKIMWYYDSLNQQCKNFYYGSCGGNANRFETEQDCQLRCLIKTGNSTCSQKVDQGYVCNETKSNQNETSNSIMKFFYDQQLKQCSSFLYRGCGGNDNRFDEENQCIEECLTDKPNVDQGCGSNMIRCNIQCRFGFERDENGCEICRCFEPCQRHQCPSGYECIIIAEQTPCVQAPCPVPRVECQPLSPDQLPDANGGIKPIIENSITNIFSQFDANVTIPCVLRQGHPTPVVYWYKERQQLQVHDAMSSGIIVRKIERLPDQSLLIRKVTLEDQGLYTCRAINDIGQDIKDVQLEIFDSIKVDIYPINRIYQLGFTAKLQCRATGYPLPRVTWMRNNVPLINTTRTTLQNDGSLIIHPYKREDAGPYVCNATNKKESVTQVAYLEVKETHVEATCEDQPTFANCELVLRHNFCDVYFDYCCRTCSQHAQYSPSSTSSEKTPNPRIRRHLLS
ncbi:hypothetical protein I4U23_018475 [Adineta vaga]|nr:hypothetical protein I4U23_018475 [Adineta vaga]